MTAVFTTQLLAVLHDRRVEDILLGKEIENEDD